MKKEFLSHQLKCTSYTREKKIIMIFHKLSHRYSHTHAAHCTLSFTLRKSLTDVFFPYPLKTHNEPKLYNTFLFFFFPLLFLRLSHYLLGAVCALKPLLVVIIAAPLHISYYNSYALLLQNKGGMFKIFIIAIVVVSD